MSDSPSITHANFCEAPTYSQVQQCAGGWRLCVGCEELRLHVTKCSGGVKAGWLCQPVHTEQNKVFCLHLGCALGLRGKHAHLLL